MLMDDFNAFYPSSSPRRGAEGVTPRRLREASNLPTPEISDEQQRVLKDARRIGLLQGCLEALRWQVPDDVRAKIEAVLAEASTQDRGGIATSPAIMRGASNVMSTTVGAGVS